MKGNIGKESVMRRWWGPDLKSQIELVGTEATSHPATATFQYFIF